MPVTLPVVPTIKASAAERYPDPDPTSSTLEPSRSTGAKTSRQIACMWGALIVCSQPIREGWSSYASLWSRQYFPLSTALIATSTALVLTSPCLFSESTRLSFIADIYIAKKKKKKKKKKYSALIPLLP
eukprot:TRINITY_DN238_c0_g1_i3.p2 TRINITY_DN238_c0_g1~~TRINITY_DN238_c0_g1_i3.p2  ORF type:complete len:129 (+),score=26.37 TRINITY_DN238_c0_g1_i3:93-479(+)